jgi:tRNA-Thr(GGU) m(6)t(6)A37 methyltransferase TsaA
MQNSFTFEPIAYFECNKKQNLEASSQGILDPDSIGLIDLKKYPQHKEMLESLDGFSHLWIIFIFHQNSGTWKPKVLPPRANKKVGVFASRSPYRPSPIGMSAVKIDRIEGSKIYVSGHDLVDQTPILDIKPYLTYADSFPEAKRGWLDETDIYQVEIGDIARKKIDFLKSQGLMEMEATIEQQLRFHPTDKQRKRVRPLNESPHHFIFSYRTWRIFFELRDKTVFISDIKSGYTQEELTMSEDPFADKSTHRSFNLLK